MSRDHFPVFALCLNAPNGNKSKVFIRPIGLHSTVKWIASKPMKGHIVFQTMLTSTLNNFLIGNIFKILKVRTRQ
ncbi:hypothetical protein ACZ75_03895 [Massilia sp. NR 4-1]|nr:hypothetical protein ACZ75_03895 [Massilia sp. NR 4-1]